MWAAELVRRKASLETENLATSATACSINITELAADSSSVETDDLLAAQHTNCCSSLGEPVGIELEKMPPNYVAMRD